MEGIFQFEDRDPDLKRILKTIDIVPHLDFHDDPADITPAQMRYRVRELGIPGNWEVEPLYTGFAQTCCGYEFNDKDPRVIRRYGWPVGLELTVVENNRTFVIKFPFCMRQGY